MKVMTFAILAISITVVAASPVNAADVPDAISVEWQGMHPCEKLFEDTHIRVARCTFPPGAVHVCHSHPSYLYYTISGGQAQVQDEKGIRKIEVATGAFVNVPPTPWHEFTNVGDNTMQFVVVEKKYESPPIADQSVCPKNTATRTQ
jgi:quercetin dioxygenase-like cupin family protein